MERKLVDLHVLLSPIRKKWHGELFDSLRGQECNIFTVDAIPGNVGRGRVLGYQHGDAPYVAFADDDDVVEPDAVSACVKVLQENKNAVGVYTDEVWIDEQGGWLRDGQSTGSEWSVDWHLSTSFGVHHLIVMRRDLVVPLLPRIDGLERSADWVLTRLLALQGEWIHVPVVGYRWRRHIGGVSRSPMPQRALDIVNAAVNTHLKSRRQA